MRDKVLSSDSVMLDNKRDNRARLGKKKGKKKGAGKEGKGRGKGIEHIDSIAE